MILLKNKLENSNQISNFLQNFYPKKFYVKSNQPFEKIPEWKVVEIQGELNLREDKISEKEDESKPNVKFQKRLDSDCIQEGFGGKKFGDIHFDESGTPILVLGHHTMTGKITKVSPPFGVLAAERNEKGEYSVEAIIREKIIFKTRPKPIITFVPSRK